MATVLLNILLHGCSHRYFISDGDEKDAEQDATDLDDSDPNSDIDEAVLLEEEPLYGRGYEQSHDNVYPEYVSQIDSDHPINCSLNESTSFIQSSELSLQLDYLAAEQQLYVRRLEEGYDLPDSKCEAWLKLHHSMSLSDQQSSSQLLGEERFGLQTSSNVSSVAIDIPVSSPAITSLNSAASSSETSNNTALTHVCQMMHPNPTQLKLTHPKPHNPLKPVPVNPGMPSSGSSRSIDITKQSPLAELVSVPKIDSQKKV